MKKLLFVISANFICIIAFTQFVYKIKGDSVLVTNDTCATELNLENSTKNVKGFLYNKGNGRTEFRRGAIKLNDSTYLIGADTLKFFSSGSSGGNSWSLTGNSGTIEATNFLGTIDNKTLAFRTNNIERAKIDLAGNLGIGISSPTSKLHVVDDNATTTSVAMISSASLTTGNLLNLYYNGNTEQIGLTGLKIAMYGTPVSGPSITYGAYINNYREGANSYSYGLQTSATLGNYNVGLNAYANGINTSYGIIATTGGSANTNTGISVNAQGTGNTVYGISVGASAQGANSVNRALWAGAQNGKFNYAIVVPPNFGTIGFGTLDPDSSAMLDVVSSVRGVLLPRMTTAQQTAIIAPKTGLIIFNTDIGAFSYYNGSNWSNITTQKPLVGTTTSSSTPTPNADINEVFTVTALSNNAVFGAPTGTAFDGQRLMIRIKDNGFARLLAWNSIYRAGTDLPLPTITQGSKTMYVGFMYNSAEGKWDLISLLNI